MKTSTVTVGGRTCRVYERGEGETVVYFAGLAGLPKWSAFLDRLADHRRVVVPSLPGYPGGGTAEDLDEVIDWVVAALDLVDAVGARGADLVGASVGAALAAEVAAVTPTLERLVLIAPLGVNAADDPVRNQLGALKRRPELLANDTAALAQYLEAPPDADELEALVERERALATNARLLWPLLDTGLAKRLYRVTASTLIVWGEDDCIVPSRYGARYAEAIAGPTEVEILPGAGHLVDVDAPDELAKRIVAFLSSADAG
jgi:pimeloyl-ACP methyl ester carboxylesterase